jgi:hypothetical protein
VDVSYRTGYIIRPHSAHPNNRSHLQLLAQVMYGSEVTPRSGTKMADISNCIRMIIYTWEWGIGSGPNIKLPSFVTLNGAGVMLSKSEVALSLEVGHCKLSRACFMEWCTNDTVWFYSFNLKEKVCPSGISHIPFHDSMSGSPCFVFKTSICSLEYFLRLFRWQVRYPHPSPSPTHYRPTRYYIGNPELLILESWRLCYLDRPARNTSLPCLPLHQNVRGSRFC